MSKFIILDGSSWLYRAYHAMASFKTSTGQPTGAVLGLNNMLKRLIKDYRPTNICVVFDPRGATFRNRIYPEYKANREGLPDDLRSQFPFVIDLIHCLGLPILSLKGIEADDVIGTIARSVKDDVLIVTGDKDMAQLVDARVQLLDTMKKQVIDSAAVQQRFGVAPTKIIDYLALVGDSSDNIPSMPGVGPKTALNLLAEHKSADGIIRNAHKVKGKLGEGLRANLHQLPLNLELVTIRCDIPLPQKPQTMRLGQKDVSGLTALYRKLEFKNAVP